MEYLQSESTKLLEPGDAMKGIEVTECSLQATEQTLSLYVPRSIKDCGMTLCKLVYSSASLWY